MSTASIIARWISVIGGSTLLIAGTIGGLFNILIFSHKTLRKCSCSWYILVAAIFDLLTLDHPLVLRILADGFGLDLISMNNLYCKLRFFTGQIASFVPITLTCLATIDRWASSCRSVRIRQWSSKRIALYSIFITIFTWSLIAIPNLFVNEIVNGVCKQISTIYSNYAAFFLNPVLYGLLPVSVLGSFGYATYINIHKIANRQHQHGRNLGEQLTRSLILQCISFIFSQIFYTLWNLYLTFTRNQIKSSNRLDIEALFTQLTRLLFYFNYVSTFYINLIASKYIRHLVKSYFLLLICRKMPHNRIDPIQTRSNQPTAARITMIQLTNRH